MSEEGAVQETSTPTEVAGPDRSDFEATFNELYNEPGAPETQEPESEATSESEEGVEEAEEAANPFEDMLKEESDDEENESEEEDEDEEAGEDEKPAEEESKPQKQSRAQTRIRQLNKRAKEAETQRDNVYQEYQAVRHQALQMKNKFDGWAKQQTVKLETAERERDSFKAELEIYSSEEYDSEDPTARARARLVKELRDKELTPVKRELLALKKAEQERQASAERQQKQARISQDADRFRTVTREAIDKTLLNGVDGETFNETDRKFLNAALLGFQANKVSPEQAAQTMKRIMAKWSAAQMKAHSAPRKKALDNSSKLPKKARNEPVKLASKEPTTEQFLEVGMTRPQWEMMGRPPLDTLK